MERLAADGEAVPIAAVGLDLDAAVLAEAADQGAEAGAVLILIKEGFLDVERQPAGGVDEVAGLHKRGWGDVAVA